MDSPLDAFPPETSDGAPSRVSGPLEVEVRDRDLGLVRVPHTTEVVRARPGRGSVALAIAAAGVSAVAQTVDRWRLAWRARPSLRSAWARSDRLGVVATAALTSVAVSLLTMWLWKPAKPSEAPSVAVASAANAEAQLPDPQLRSNTPEVASRPPVPVAAPRAIVSAPTAPPSPVSPLVIATEPAGARVTINGVGWGTTPLTIRHLPPGAKRIRVTRSGYQSEERVVDLGAGRPSTTLRITLREAREVRAAQ